jgi:hypothetical protein
MKRFGLVLGLVSCALAFAGGAGASGGSPTDAGCRPVHGVGAGQDLGGGNTMATITHAGVLNGTTTAHFDITGGAPPAFTIAGTLVLTTKQGTLTVSLAGTFNVATGVFNASGPITASTGKLAGSTGTLTLSGVENLATGAFTETITGTLCGAGAEEDD